MLHGDPPPEFRQHATGVLAHTVLRRQGIVRGRILNDGTDASEKVRKSARSKDRCEKLLRFANGDWSVPTCVHYENGCCLDQHGQYSRAVAVNNFYAAAVDGGALCDELSDVPSKVRWGSLQEHEAEQLLGDWFFKLHLRACSLAFRSWDSAGVGLDDADDDYRRMVKGKAFRLVCLANDEDYLFKKACRSFFLSSTEHLWARLQHMEEAGNAIVNIQHPDHNPILASRQWACTLIFQPALQGPMKTVFDHYKRQPDYYYEMVTYTRITLVSIDSQDFIPQTIIIK